MSWPKKPRKPSTVYSVRDVLHATLLVLEVRGNFVSQKQAEKSGEMPTSHWVLDRLRKGIVAIAPDPDKAEKITEIIDHFTSVNSDGDEFVQKVQEILRIGQVTERMIGFIVALPSLFDKKYNRTDKLMKFAEKYAESKAIGEVGKREEFCVKVIEIGEFQKTDDDGSHYTLYIYRLADQLNNFGFFFSREKLPVEQWDCFAMRATPKKHDVNKDTGVRETQFSRVRITEILGRGTAE